MSENNYSQERSSQLKLRVSGDLHQRLKKEADRNERSLNAEIIYRLERSFEPTVGLHEDLRRLIDLHIESEVQARLQEIAATIGGRAS